MRATFTLLALLSSSSLQSVCGNPKEPVEIRRVNSLLAPRAPLTSRPPTKSSCTYQKFKTKWQYYYVTLVLDPSWKKYCLRPDLLEIMSLSCTYFVISNLADPELKEDVCTLKIRFTRDPKAQMPPRKNLRPLGCLEDTLRCLTGLLGTEWEMPRPKCEQVHPTFDKN